MLRGVVKTHPEREQYTDGDRYIHISAPMPQSLPCRTEKYPAGIRQRGQRDDGRQPMKQVAGLGISARPDRDGKQHDVAGGESRDRKGAYQFRQFTVPIIRLDVEQMGLKTGLLERFNERRRSAA